MTNRRGKTPEYRAWSKIKERCFKPHHPSYTDYGGRGISMCARWRGSFPAFLADVGPRPSPAHSIDRIDNDGHYEPGNCRWATRSQQVRNSRHARRLTFGGETRTICEWADRLGLKLNTITDRLRKGWQVEEALGRPVRYHGHWHGPDQAGPTAGTYFNRDRGRWAAQIQVNGRKVHLGLFDTREEAHAAYLSAKGCRAA